MRWNNWKQSITSSKVYLWPQSCVAQNMPWVVGCRSVGRINPVLSGVSHDPRLRSLASRKEVNVMAHSWTRFSKVDQAGETEVCLLYIAAVLKISSIFSDLCWISLLTRLHLSHMSNYGVHKQRTTLSHQVCVNSTFTPHKYVSVMTAHANEAIKLNNSYGTYARASDFHSWQGAVRASRSDRSTLQNHTTPQWLGACNGPLNGTTFVIPPLPLLRHCVTAWRGSSR